MPRVMPTHRIPPSMWSSGKIRLPESLSKEYVTMLEQLRLTQLSTSVEHGSIHGGHSQEETHKHFALRFTVSAGRMEFAILAPLEDFSRIGNAVLSSFSEGHVAILDIPCGTGATSGALIATLIELRRAKVMPRLPLTITVCAGDFSPAALTLFAAMIRAITESAAAEGISVRFSCQEWDATRGDHTARLIDCWFDDCAGAAEHVVLIGNFSGALKSTGQFEAFSPNLEHILARLHDKAATLIWLEPKTNEVRDKLFVRVKDFMLRRILWFAQADGDGDGEDLGLAAEYRAEHPVSRATFPSNLLVHDFKRL